MTDRQPDDQEREERRRIIDAAWDVLRRTGYENLKIQAVIRVSGVSVGSFYRQFDSKQDLMLALLREELRRATAVLQEKTKPGAPEERVRAWVDAIVSLAFGQSAGPRARWFTTMPADVRDMLADAGRDPSEDTGEPLRRAIEDGTAAGVFFSDDPAIDALLVQSLCSRLDEGGTRQWLGQERQAAVTTVADFVLASLTNPSRARGAAPS